MIQFSSPNSLTHISLFQHRSRHIHQRPIYSLTQAIDLHAIRCGRYVRYRFFTACIISRLFLASLPRTRSTPAMAAKPTNGTKFAQSISNSLWLFIGFAYHNELLRQVMHP